MLSKIRTGIIGQTGRGGFGHKLHEGFAQCDRFEIIAVADDHESVVDTQTRLGAKRAYRSYEKMLADESLDAVVVAPRFVDHHEEMVLAALGAGAHVYCEKPLARSLAECDKMIRAAELAGLRLAVGLPAAHESRFTRLLEIIRRGELGEVVSLRGVCKWDARGGGEDALVLGVHFADLIRRIVGQPQAAWGRVRDLGSATAVTREGGEGIGPVAGECFDGFYSIDGLVASLHSYRADVMDRDLQPYGLEIVGTRGAIFYRAPYADGSVWHSPIPYARPGVESWNLVEEKVSPYAEYHAAGAIDFADSIVDQRAPKCSGEDGRAALEMIHAIYLSSASGEAVPLPLTQRAHPLETR